MRFFRFYNYVISDQKGYTILEVLISASIFGVILIPAVVLLGNILNLYSSSDLLVAANLANEEMGKSLHHRLFENEEREVKLDNLTWRIKKQVSEKDGLLSIKVEVSREKDKKVLASLYTEKYLGSQE